ncbi:CPSF A subunit region-domain-containing protein [Coniochaeta sp. 2T2.1]|nr:CPSF A subunit region-domain-containing protein [Coniochaeta sp. 2T2.1]
MQCYTELTPPTAVTHSVALPFVSAQSNNLVVAKSSLLQIFTTKTISAELDNAQIGDTQSRKPANNKYDSRLLNDDDGLESSFLGGDSILQRSDRANNTKLILVAEIPLAGTITGLARVKAASTQSGGDALLIAFKDAKLSLVAWDPERLALSTISIHYYEQDELQGSPWAAPLSDYVNFLAADPSSRCAALKFGARNLAIVPFKYDSGDIDMDDWDEELDGTRDVKNTTALANGTSNIQEDTPYSPSFVLRLPNLDPSLLHPVHLAFLYEYREPTFGILSSIEAPSNALGRNDHLSYMVFTLDLQQKASTTILSVGGLPRDLFQVVALPSPVGGALLVGPNELVHIGQSGKPHGVAVNPMTKQVTSFGLVDQSDLNLRLEGSLIAFKLDGRSVAGLSVKLAPQEAGGAIIPCGIASLTRLGRNSMFAGIEDGDSLVFGWTRKQSQTSKRKSKTQELDVELDMDDEDVDLEDDDDLYGDEPAAPAPTASADASAKSGELSFRIQDRLLSIAPIRAMTYGKPATPSDEKEAEKFQGVQSDLQLVCAVGKGNASALAVINREIQPKVIGRFEFPEARGFWAMSAQKPVPKAIQGDRGAATLGNDYDTLSQYDKYMIVAKVDLDGYETSDVYALTAAGFESLTGTEFEPAAGITIEAGTMGNHKRIIQVLKSEVRCYDGDLGLSQIIPMLDEDTGFDPRVISASIADPYLLLIRDDSSAYVAQIDKNSELEEIEREDKALATTKWLSGCLYNDHSGMFATSPEKDQKPGDAILMFLLSAAGALYIYRLPDLTKPIYVAQGLTYIPPYLTASYAPRKGTQKDMLTELLLADLGDATHKSPYLILRHANDDLTLYQPVLASQEGKSLLENLTFQKVQNQAFAKEPHEAVQDDAAQEQRFLPMRTCSNIAGYSTVFLPGASPSFVIKSAKSTPKVLGLQGLGVQAFSSFHTEGCEHGFIYADSEGIARVTELPTDWSYGEIGLAVKKIPLNIDLRSVSYHPPTETYVVGCSTYEPFELPKDDDYHKNWAHENLSFKPVVPQGILKLISPSNWSVIDEVEMDPCEILMCVETISLEVSETTNERKLLIAVGTAVSKGEDLPIKGRVHVYDIAEVIPEPNRPETNRKLKRVVKEEIPRGAVTSICAVGTQGLMLIAQGQKCMVRGLKEDGTLLPVAFMDMNCYVTCVKELPQTGLCLMSDAFKGVWFTGYTEEPYKLVLFGKSSTNLEMLNADFLPFNKELYIVASDPDGNLHILEFNPDHPKSIDGHLLLHRTTFNTGAHIATSSLLLPSTIAISELPPVNGSTKDPSTEPGDPTPRHLLLASPTGVLASLSPLSETSYRRLLSMTTQLANSVAPAASMNPRAYRMPSAGSPAPGVDAGMGRNVVDGTLLGKWSELGTGRRTEVAGRVGFGGVDEVRGELANVLGWGRMGYF